MNRTLIYAMSSLLLLGNVSSEAGGITPGPRDAGEGTRRTSVTLKPVSEGTRLQTAYPGVMSVEPLGRPAPLKTPAVRKRPWRMTA